MDRLKNNWKQTPHYVRKPVVLILGMFIIILSGAIGWLPGPGGIPLFLIGVAVLATEFVWADRVKKIMLSIIHRCAAWFKSHRIVGSLLIAASLSLSLYITLTLFYNK